MLNLGPSDFVGTEQLNTLGLLNVDDKAEQLRLHNAHKVFYKQAPVYLMANFNKYRNRQGMNTRHRAYNFDLPRVTGEETGTFYYNAIKDWNGLQDRLKISSNLLSLKPKLKQYMQKLQLIHQGKQSVYH